jgi:hypothetical protein
MVSLGKKTKEVPQRPRNLQFETPITVDKTESKDKTRAMITDRESGMFTS